MKKLLIATTSALALSVAAAPAMAQEASGETSTILDPSPQDSKQLLGGTAGAGAGAAAGAAVGGPVGAVVGGFAGAIIGAEASVPEPAVQYVVQNPVEPVTIEGEVEEGMTVPQSVQVQQIPDYPEYGYVYVDGRPVIVNYEGRDVVYSPGYAVPDTAVTYVQENPVDPVTLDARVGATVPSDIEVQPVPSTPAYSYVYTDAGPVLVENSTRTVIWVKG